MLDDWHAEIFSNEQGCFCTDVGGIYVECWLYFVPRNVKIINSKRIADNLMNFNKFIVKKNAIVQACLNRGWKEIFS